MIKPPYPQDRTVIETVIKIINDVALNPELPYAASGLEIKSTAVTCTDAGVLVAMVFRIPTTYKQRLTVTDSAAWPDRVKQSMYKSLLTQFGAVRTLIEMSPIRVRSLTIDWY